MYTMHGEGITGEAVGSRTGTATGTRRCRAGL